MNGYRTNRAAAAVVPSVLNILAGLWLIIAPFVLGYYNFYRDQVATWDSIIVGCVVLVLAAIRVAAPLRNVGLSWVNFLLGIWMIISPFVLRLQDAPVVVRNDVVLGIIVAVLAIWSALATPRMTAEVR